MSGAIKTTASMVLISIHPFAFRKIFLVAAALFCFSVLCFADPVLMAQRYARPASNRFPIPDNEEQLDRQNHFGGLPQWDGRGEQKPVDLPSRGQESLLRGEETATIFRQTEFFPQLRFARG